MVVSVQGRERQKERTRQALIVATRTLLRRGVTPSVEQAADAALVSRTTAYRYFPSQRALLIAAYPQLDRESLLGDDPPADVRERVERVAAAMVRLVLENEPEMRAMLRLSLEHGLTGVDEPVLRKGRRTGWVADALTPLEGRLADVELERLTLAIAAAVGIEPFVWLVDVAELSPRRAAEVMRSSCVALLDAALAR